MNKCSVVVWEQLSKQVAALQILHVDAENRKKSGNNVYKMDQDNIITIQEELSDDFYAMAQV